MRRQVIAFGLVFLGVQLCSSKKRLPPYIEVCHRSNPHFDQCCLESANKALPYIIKGDKAINTPSFLPLRVQEISYTSPGGLVAKATNVYFHGFERIKLEKLKFDLENKRVQFLSFIDEVKADGDYELKGTTGLLQLNAKGNSSNTFYGYRSDVDMGYHFVTKEDGKKYAEIENPHVKSSFDKVTIWFDNIFPGNPEITTATNKALNDNWREFIDDFQPLITELTLNVGFNLIKNTVGDNPFDEIFPE